MRRFRPIALLLFVALFALVAAGCGASDKQEYIKQNNKIQEKVAPKISSSATDDASMDTSIKAIDTAIADFKELEVPADYKKPHDQMVEALTELRDQLTELKTAEDPAELVKLQKRATDSQEKYNDAITQMNEDRL